MNPRPHKNQHGFNDGSGILVELKILHSNDTHMEVVTPLQLLGYMATLDTKFYVQLRNPSDRTISYLFHWLKKGYMWKQIPLTNVTEAMVHNLFEPLVSSFHECVAKEGELACVYKYAGSARFESRVPENLLRHSLYVVYLEESFKFVPARQFQFRTMDEYSLDQVGTVKSLMSFFGLTFQKSKSDLQEHVRNIGSKRPVWNKTIDMLDNFFKPYNERLAKLLNNDKWLFKRKS
ncbi:carbohydrate sulfotransferase 15-like [Watersipora subatra]|uniref:carbohydrate sulfotransferase 15-like n=1 Tax=Watersipora subatra TaxID=2589382 RepID=UPI00355B41E3